MYLKSIEVQGFKSFANKILFEFHNGITCIVGPNGSGKSNVGDAVRWVLGEQSAKQLRGSSMQDVIFSGTENRRPLGFAYVAITLDNSDHQLNIDYEEVTVARRVYRSGESEYLINGSTCRLKDVNELFYDTGIGKEGYSIIGQGQIDKILSGRPEERRELFDEAAGIVKFKRRKAIAIKKLEEEQTNLVRVKDILSELEKQVGPLEKQSETARTYLKLKEELKNYEIHTFILEQAAANEELRKTEENIKIVSGDLAQTIEKSENLKEEYSRLEEENKQLEALLGETKTKSNEVVILRGNLTGQINVLKEQINTEKMNEVHINDRVKTIHKTLKERESELDTLAQNRSGIGDQLSALKQKQEAVNEQLSATEEQIGRCEEEIEQNKTRIIELLNEKSGLSAKIQRYEAMLEQNMIRRAQISQKLIRSKSDEEVKEYGAKQFIDQLQEKEKDALFHKAKLEDLQREQIKTDERYNETNIRLNKKQQAYHELHTKAESLKNLAERYEGYGNSIKRVMEVRERIGGVHGVVADIIRVDKKYEVAVETALGGSIQNIVTDTEQTAKRLIEFLKKNKYGRATFLPLNAIRPKGEFNQKDVLKENGVIQLASELVKTEATYSGLMKFLLGKIVVVDTIDHALEVAKKYQYSLRIVTLDGELLNAGGSMTGGAFKNSSNLLGRKREIDDLESNANKALEEYNELLAEQKELQGMRAHILTQLDEIKDVIQKNELDTAATRFNLKQIEKEIKEIQEGREDFVRENRQLDGQIKDINEQKNQILSMISDIEAQNKSAENLVHETNQTLAGVKEERDQLLKKVSELSLEYQNLSQKDMFAAENRKRIRQEIQSLSEEKEKLLTSLETSLLAIDEKQKQILEIRNKIEASGENEKMLKEDIEKLTIKRDVCIEQQKQFFDKREAVSERSSTLDKELFRLNNIKEKVEENLDAQTNYLWTEYEMMPSEALALKNPELNHLPDLKKLVQSLKSRIRSLGNVNVNAIDDYKEILERYTFMKTQYDDLTESELALKQIIEELDTGMRLQFEEKFDEIKMEFDKVFKELFGGGRGTLELMEGEDIIEAGIRIISQPPGKKLQNMMQLSGGEKALTAIALLFAIQNLKPSPFCLLDEIEAALDDSNVGRFSNYLHKLTKNTQFIIITHRRGTMVAADRLYGITMQEKGVSTLVSVNLIEEDLDK